MELTAPNMSEYVDVILSKIPVLGLLATCFVYPIVLYFLWEFTSSPERKRKPHDESAPSSEPVEVIYALEDKPKRDAERVIGFNSEGEMIFERDE